MQVFQPAQDLVEEILKMLIAQWLVGANNAVQVRFLERSQRGGRERGRDVGRERWPKRMVVV